MKQNHIITVTDSYTTATGAAKPLVSLEQSLALHIFSFVWCLNMINATSAATVLLACFFEHARTF